MPDNKTAHFAEARKLDALVLIDGVEVPFTWLEVQFNMDAPSVATVAVEPDALTDLWRPKSWVHIFVRQTFFTDTRDEQVLAKDRDTSFDERTMKLYWEGELTGIKDLESAEQRATIITATDLWNVPMLAQLSMVSIGADLDVPMVNGSTFFQGIVGSEGIRLVIDGLIAYLFGVNADGSPSDSSANAEKDVVSRIRSLVGRNGQAFNKPNMGDLARLLLEYLVPFNASYGLQVVRTKLLERLTSIADNTLGLFVEQVQAQQLMQLLSSQIGASTVMQLLGGMLQQLFHHTISIPCPTPVLSKSTGGPAQVAGYRSMGVIPNLYYIVPPLCNWLFPDQYQHRQVDRDYLNEPTRLGLKTPLADAIGDLIQLAPGSLQSRLFGAVKENDSTRKTFTAQQSENIIRPADDLRRRLRQIGFFQVDAEGNPQEDINLLMFMLDEELEKGIIYVQDTNDYQALLARASLNAGEQADDESRQDKFERYKELAGKPGTYPYYMSLLAEYQLAFRKLSRGLVTTGPFNMWPVIGLPMMLVRQGRSYRGLLTGLVSRIDFSGQSQTTYQLDYGQLTRPDFLSDQQLKYVKQASDEIASATAAAERLEELGLIAERATPVEQYAELTKLSEEIFSAVRKVTEAQAYKLSVGVMKDLGAESFATSGLDVRRAMFKYMGLMRGVTGRQALSSITPSLSQEIADNVASIKQGSDEQATVLEQMLKNFDGKNTTSVVAYYEELVDAIGHILYVLYFNTAPNSVSFNEDTSYDMAAYLAALVTNTPIINKETALTQRLEAERIVLLDEISSLEAQIVERQQLISLTSTPVESPEKTQALQQLANFPSEATLLTQKNTAQNSLDQVELDLKAARQRLASAEKALDDVFVVDWLATLDSFRVGLAAITQADGALDRTAVVSLYNRLTITKRRPDRTDSVVESVDLSPSFSVDLFAVTLELIRDLYRQYDLRPQPPTLKPAQGPRSLDAVSFGSLIANVATELLEVTALQITADQQAEVDNFTDALTRSNNSLEDVTKELNQKAMDIPPVFPFANEALTFVDQIDDALSNVVVPLNAAGRYSSRDTVRQPGVSALQNQTRLNPNTQRDTILRYDEFIRLARKIFPFAHGDAGTEYQEHKVAGDPHRWANEVQARRAVSLGEFLKLHDLTLTQHQSASPFGSAPYYVLKQRKPDGVVTAQSSDGLGGYFSKFGQQDDAVDLLSRSMKQMREKVAQDAEARKILGESERQQLVIEYTKRHAGPATYQGKK